MTGDNIGDWKDVLTELFLRVLIVFEGIDGTGKTTQAELLSKRLAAEGFSNEVFREPGGTGVGEGVRDLLLHKLEIKIDPVTEFLLFSASRAQLVREKIALALNSKKIVILDRYFYSSIAYQGFGRGLPVPEVESISRFATQGLAPDIVFLIQLDIETATKRMRLGRRSSDRMEDAELRFFQRVIEGFLYCAKKEPSRFVIVEGDDLVDKVSEKIFNHVMKRIRKVTEEKNATT